MRRIDWMKKYRELHEIIDDTLESIEKEIPISDEYDLLIRFDEILISKKGYSDKRMRLTIEEAESLIKALEEALYEDVKVIVGGEKDEKN